MTAPENGNKQSLRRSKETAYWKFLWHSLTESSSDYANDILSLFCLATITGNVRGTCYAERRRDIVDILSVPSYRLTVQLHHSVECTCAVRNR